MRYQGVAGSLVGTSLSYGISISLGFAGTVEVNTNGNGTRLLKGYHSAAYLSVGLSSAALILSMLFVRIPKDTREGWGGRRSTTGDGTPVRSFYAWHGWILHHDEGVDARFDLDSST